MLAIVQKLASLIETHGRKKDLELALRNAQAHDVPSIREIQSLDDYLRYVDALAACLPIGMALVASVVITAEEGVTLLKGGGARRRASSTRCRVERARRRVDRARRPVDRSPPPA